jgi:sugar phosphate isomerase/epimerase
MSNPIALQLWTIRNAMASDVEQALRRVKSAGFSAVEIAPLAPGMAPERLAACLARHELAVVSIHGDLPAPNNIDLWTKVTRECQCPKIVWHGWPRDPRFDSLAGVRDLISACNDAGKIARDHGFQMGIHNHWWEFESLDGDRPIRLFHELLHPAIFWQLDVYWAQTAGVDPADALLDFEPRIGSLHWKDGPAIQGEAMTALGRGNVDVPRVMKAITHPVDWIIELDECATDPLDAAQQSLFYLESLRNLGTHP